MGAVLGWIGSATWAVFDEIVVVEERVIRIRQAKNTVVAMTTPKPTQPSVFTGESVLGASAFTACPHFRQNCEPSGSSVLHFAQSIASLPFVKM